MDATDMVPMRLRDQDPRVNRITGAIVDSALAVHRVIGNGMLERAYEAALAHELALRGFDIARQVPLDLEYRGLRIPRAYILDMVVAGQVVVELKAVEALTREHFAQMTTYLRFSGHRVGLLVNFHAPLIKGGIQRVVLGS